MITKLGKLKDDVTMNRNCALLFASVVMFFSGCASTPTKDIAVAAQADPKANFSGYKPSFAMVMFIVLMTGEVLVDI